MRCEAIETDARPQTAALACCLCGCTDERACPGGCSWISFHPPVCSACEDIAAEIMQMKEEQHAQAAPPTIRAISSGLFGNQNCPASSRAQTHSLLWLDETTGYCLRCREGFVA